MSSAIYLDNLRKQSVIHNPYYEFFRESIKQTGSDAVGNIIGLGFGDVYKTLPSSQRGYGVFIPSYYHNNQHVQLGGSLASLFHRLFSFAKPLVTRGIESAVKLTQNPMVRRGVREAVNFGTNVAKDLIEGQDIKQSLKKNIKEKVSELLPSQYADIVNKTIGSGRKKNSRKRALSTRTRKKRRTIVNKKYSALKLIS